MSMKDIFSTIKTYFKKPDNTSVDQMQQKKQINTEEQVQDSQPPVKEEEFLNQTEKPTGKGIKRKWIIAIFFIIIMVTLSSLMAGTSKKNKIKNDEEQPSRESQMQNLDGNHLRDVPSTYTDAAKLEAKKTQEQKKAEQATNKTNTTAPQIPKPTIPAQPKTGRSTQLTAKQQARMKEYQAMEKAYASPIKFELSKD